MIAQSCRSWRSLAFSVLFSAPFIAELGTLLPMLSSACIFSNRA